MSINQEDEYLALNGIIGINEAIAAQKEKLKSLRSVVKDLKFIKLDMAGDYTSITYKAIDGGKMHINLNPFEVNLIDVADSNFNTKLRFIIPEIKSYGDMPDEDTTDVLDSIVKQIDTVPVMAKFVKLLNKKSISEISYILKNSDNLMELAEWACIFERVTLENDEPVMILKDGLLRSKALKDTLIKVLIDILKQKKKHVKLVGVSKTSAILSLISTAIFLEKIIPEDAIGYIKIPWELEKKAYTWTGSGKINKTHDIHVSHLDFAFGELYVVKLARTSNLLVTMEFPKDWGSNQNIYSDAEIHEIISYLAKDSKHSYPVIGYPQTIMRAHEAAARLGFSASIIRDEIRDKIMENLDKDAKAFVRDAWLIIDFVDKGVLGGGKYG